MAETATSEIRRAPTHPGELLRKDILPDARLGVSAAADRLGVSRQLLHRILNEEASVTPEMALRLGRLFGNGPELWLGMQKNFDLWHARKSIAKKLKQIEPVAA